MKKRIIFIFTLSILSASVIAQVGINADNSVPDQSAMLDVKSFTKGMLPPRMTFQQRNAIVNPAEGLIVMCTNCTADGKATVSIFLNGKWQILNFSCAIPNTPVQRTHIPDVTQITWKWSTVPIATGYKWNIANDYNTAIDAGMDTTHVETGLNCVTPYTRYMWAYNDCGNSNVGTLTQTTSSIAFPAPISGTHVPTLYQIVWNWSTVPDATGYKWNYLNDYNTAIDMGTVTSQTEPGVNCGTLITRYVWAYSTCGISNATTLTQMATDCPANCMPITDSRDGKVYNAVLIGSQCWMRENLNIGTKINNSVNQSDNNIFEKYCYNNDETNCANYGGLYQWAEMVQYLNGATNTTTWNPAPSGNVQGICPTGWHVPTDAAWTTLTTYLGGTSVAGGKMKEAGTSHWQSNTGTSNSSGFTGLPSGYCSSGGFSNLTYETDFWSTLESSAVGAYYRYLSYSNLSVGNNYKNKTYGVSVRCIKDCDNPPTQGTHIPGATQIVWNWNIVPGALGYKWNTINNFNTATDMGTSTSKTETGLTCNTAYTRYVWAYNNQCGNSSATILTQTTNILPSMPTPGVQTPFENQIIWNWNTASGATGYKWNNINDYATALDMGIATSKTENGLDCFTSYTRYVWAYNECGYAPPISLTQTTSACFTCGSSITINHVAGNVAPVTKTVFYGTVTNIPGEVTKCWITSNLGASQQATAWNDNTEASSGWYWQFNRKQGYQYTTSRTPNTTWINSISENSNWTTSNDPCTIELGADWHIPTNTEWFNVDASGNWTNPQTAYTSNLKIHAAGILQESNGVANYRGGLGNYSSNTQTDLTGCNALYFDSAPQCNVGGPFPKARGLTLRCIRIN